VAARPTVYPELNEVLGEFVRNVQTILSENFCGAYLQGSFALGDADEHSDVDFIVVTHKEISDAVLEELQAMHERLHGLESPWAQHLEGSYITRDQLRRIDHSRAPLLYLDNGATELIRDNHDNTAVVRWSLRERGVVLAGPEPPSLVDPVSTGDLRTDLLQALDDWEVWLRTLDSWSARLQPLVVLSYCRILHTIETGTVGSKREAGEWALNTLDAEWHALVGRALADRPDPWAKVRRPADPQAVERTRAFVAYVAGLIKRYEGTPAEAR
jgi:predicted nucleotidyltransferase